MDNLNIRVVSIRAAMAKIGDDLLRRVPDVFQKDRCLLKLLSWKIPVVRVAGIAACADDQPLQCVTAMLAFTPYS